MSKLACVLAALGLLLGSPLSGQTINVQLQAQPGQRALQLESGGAVPDGNEVRVGVFDEGFDVAAHANDLAALQGAWNAFGSTTVRTLSGQPGRFSASLASEAGTFPGKKLYVWVFNTTSNGSPQADLGDVEAHGLYASDAVSWQFPSPGLPPLNSVTVTSDQVNEVLVGGAESSHLILQAVPGMETLTYAAWRSETFTAGTPDDLRDPTDDPDHDGLNNAMEYLTGGDPETSEVSPFASSQEAGNFLMSFPRVKAVPAGTEVIEISTDLSAWQQVGYTVDSESHSEMLDEIVVTVPIRVTDFRRFVRVRLDE